MATCTIAMEKSLSELSMATRSNEANEAICVQNSVKFRTHLHGFSLAFVHDHLLSTTIADTITDDFDSNRIIVLIYHHGSRSLAFAVYKSN